MSAIKWAARDQLQRADAGTRTSVGMDGKSQRGFYPTDWHTKVKGILIWLDFALQEKTSNCPNFRSEKKKDHKSETPCTQTGETPLQHWGSWFYLMNEFSRSCNTPLIMPAESSSRLGLEISYSRGAASPGASCACGCGIRSAERQAASGRAFSCV